MKTTYLKAVFAALLLTSVTAAQAVMVAFNPATPSANAGDTVDIAITISDLGDGAAPSLGVYDLTVGYDPLLLAPFGSPSIVFGDPVLGNQLDLFGLGSVTSFDDSVAGVWNLFELSLDSVSDLDSLQAASFVLGTVTFKAIAPGTSPLSFLSATLGDAAGDPLSVSLGSGEVTVNSSPVPAPAVLWLLLPGLALVMGRRCNARIP